MQSTNVTNPQGGQSRQVNKQISNSNNNNNNNNRTGANRGNSNSFEARREKEQAEAIKKYTVGQIVEGTIMQFFKAGNDHEHKSALVKLKAGGTALMLYNEIPGYPRNILSEVYAKDDIIDVEVTSIRANKNRMSVSLKPVLRRKFSSKLEPGHIVEATVVDQLNYGYFVDLGGGLEALLHNDNLDTDFHNHLEKFAIGEKTEVVILRNENEGKRIGVGRKQLFE